MHLLHGCESEFAIAAKQKLLKKFGEIMAGEAVDEEGSATVRSSCSLGRVRCSSGVSGKAALSITRRPGASDRRAGWGAESCYSLERLS